VRALPEPGPWDRAVAVGLWGAGLAWLLPMLGGMTLLHQVLPPDRCEGVSRLYCRGQVALTGSRWRAVVHPEVRADQPYLFAQNHVNLLDHVTMYPATPHFKQGIELAQHFKIPFYGWFMKARGTIGVVRGAGPEALREAMRQEVARGHSILGFPEGTRTRDGRVGPFRRGLFHLARDLELPVVPTAVTGMYAVLRTGSWVLRPGHQVTVWCEAPLATRGLPESAVPELAEACRAAVAARVDAWWEGAA
jgi:1-acyl-sn-glycerol-3-phosphate acyltransferase